MTEITNVMQAKIDNLDDDLKKFVNKLISSNTKNLKLLDRIMKQSDAQQLQLEKLNEKMQHIAQTDQLTSSFNRFMCEEQLKELHKKKENFSIMLVDIDNFKEINEKHSITIADKVLIQMYKNIKRFVQPSSFIGRWSGDTFMIIDNLLTMDQMIETAEEICNEVEKYFFNDIGKVTVSIGVAYASSNFDIQNLVNQCNIALKKAKENGKNQVSL